MKGIFFFKFFFKKLNKIDIAPNNKGSYNYKKIDGKIANKILYI